MPLNFNPLPPLPAPSVPPTWTRAASPGIVKKRLDLSGGASPSRRPPTPSALKIQRSPLKLRSSPLRHTDLPIDNAAPLVKTRFGDYSKTQILTAAVLGVGVAALGFAVYNRSRLNRA